MVAMPNARLNFGERRLIRENAITKNATISAASMIHVLGKTGMVSNPAGFVSI